MSTLLATIGAFLYREVRHLDDREFDDWLALYAPDCSYWMPAWDDDDALTTDPQREISLIYYPNRNGLEDRVFRIKTERSSASMPEPRTSHMLANIELLAERGDEVDVRYNFHTLSHRFQKTEHYFGTVFATLRQVAGGDWRFARKKVVLKDDYINQVVDIYHL